MAADERHPVEAVSFGGAPEDASAADTRRWLRDMGALLALPALWVDHEPLEIATGLLSVLFGILRLDAAYARFDDSDGGRPCETWRPSGTAPPAELLVALATDGAPASGIATSEIHSPDRGTVRIAGLPLALPWETGLVVVSAARSDFPTAMETHLLRVAVSQAAIAIHTARRLAQAHSARYAAEDALHSQTALLQSLIDEVEPSIASIARLAQAAGHLIAETDANRKRATSRRSVRDLPERGRTASADAPPLPLTGREMEVLGLLAQGLSNKEIAGVIWLSDRTVERHITSLYRKIGVARRSEATAFALRHGVV